MHSDPYNPRSFEPFKTSCSRIDDNLPKRIPIPMESRKRKYPEQVEIKVQPRVYRNGSSVPLADRGVQFRYIVNPYDGLVRGFSVIFDDANEKMVQKAICELDGYELHSGAKISISNSGPGLFTIRGIPEFKTKEEVKKEARRILGGIARVLSESMAAGGQVEPDLDIIQEVEETNDAFSKIVFSDPLGPRGNKRFHRPRMDSPFPRRIRPPRTV